jgi:protoporphyrinogen oxidase
LSDRNPHRVVIIGAGPAGLTAGYELSRRGYQAEILEADSRYVGGLARTVEYQGFRFDIGGHRFFSKNPEIEALWTELLGARMRDC